MTSPRIVTVLRNRGAQESARVGFIELFFDLVFVFAVTQLSHGLISHYTVVGAVQMLLLFMAVWAVWIYTSWATSWLNPQARPVRLLLLAMMLAGLVLSTSIPEAFGERGLYFAAAYGFMQVFRSVFATWALRHNPGNFRNFQRITFWLTLSAIIWIAGGFASGGLRFALWAVALAIDSLSPWAGFWTPGLGRSTTADWDIEGTHMAERCGLFIIIALGESILVTGATFAELEWDWITTAAFVIAFIGSVAMWWIHFDTGHERGSSTIAMSADPGRLARLAYTYFHQPIVAGIIVSAVADEFVLVHPVGRTDVKTAIAILGGPGLFLIGTTLFKRAIVGQWPLSHVTGIAALAALVFGVESLSPLALGTCAMLILVVVAASESVASRLAEPR